MTTTQNFGRIMVSGKEYVLYKLTTDGTEAEIQVLDTSGAGRSIGEMLQGQTLQELAIQCSDGSILATCILYDDNGGIVLSYVGNERTTWQNANLEVKGLAVPITFGMKLKLNTTD